MRLKEVCPVCENWNWCGRPCSSFYKHTLGKGFLMVDAVLPLYFDKRAKKDQDPGERTMDKNPMKKSP